MKQTYAIGIDPGKTGALAIFELIEGEYYLHSVFDFEDRDLYIPLLREIAILDRCSSACIEAVHAAPGQGVSSTFIFGANFGWWCGVLDALNYSYTLVSPQKWQGLLFKDYKNSMGSLDRSTKELSLELANKLFSRDKDTKNYFKRKKDHGRSDASLIGWYGILQLH